MVYVREQKNTNMLEILKFYKKIKVVLNRFKDKLKFVEINSDLKNLQQDEYSFDYINFIINIENKEYLLFLINRSEIEVNDDELHLFENIFDLYPNKEGMLLTFNNENLDTILLKKHQLKKKIIIDKKISKGLTNRLEDLTTKPLITFKKLVVKGREIEKKFLEKKLEEELIKEFKNDISRNIPVNKKKFIKHLLSTKILEELDILYYYSSRNKKDIIEYITNFVRRIENELHSY